MSTKTRILVSTAPRGRYGYPGGSLFVVCKGGFGIRGSGGTLTPLKVSYLCLPIDIWCSDSENLFTIYRFFAPLS